MRSTTRRGASALAFAAILLLSLPAHATQGANDPMWIFLAISIGIGMTGLAAVIYFPLRWRARRRGLPEGRYLLTWLGCVAGVPAAALFPWLLQKFNAAGRATSVDLASHTAASPVPLSSAPLPEPGPLPGWAIAFMVVGTALFVVLPTLGGVLGFYVWRRPGPASLEG